ncbi:MAG: hypothetical protein J5680_06445 [Neisseriaceae bacterium]|nr:hypothetical protein [Neisseriaceae bacterium]
MSNLRFDGYILNNASILFSGSLKAKSKHYLKIIRFAARQNIKPNCSLLIAHYSLLIAHCFSGSLNTRIKINLSIRFYFLYCRKSEISA